MLILTRRPGQIIKIKPNASLDPATPIDELFRNGPIEVMVARVNGLQVRLGIHAHPSFLILRDELFTSDCV